MVLKNHQFLFHRQKPINQFIADFYCSNPQLVIEIDGDTHFIEEAIEYDKERTKVLEGYGLKILRFTNNEVINNFEGVCKKIDEEVSLRR